VFLTISFLLDSLLKWEGLECGGEALGVLWRGSGVSPEKETTEKFVTAIVYLF
jgi:hypothetical protein